MLAIGAGAARLGAQLRGCARLRPRARRALCGVTSFVRHAWAAPALAAQLSGWLIWLAPCGAAEQAGLPRRVSHKQGVSTREYVAC